MPSIPNLLRIISYSCGAIGIVLVLWGKSTQQPYGKLMQAGMLFIISSTILIIFSYVLRMLGRNGR